MTAYETAQEFRSQFTAEELDNARRKMWGSAYESIQEALRKQKAEMGGKDRTEVGL